MSNLENEGLKTFIEKLKLYNEEKRKFLNNSDYMDDLVKKIRYNTYVFDDNTQEKTNMCSTYNNISFLYKIVNDYATSNYLSPVRQSNYDIYYIKYNNYIFSIFEKQNDEKKPIYGCYDVFLKESQLPYCINFEDIKNNKKVDINDFSRGLVVELKDIINKLYEEGFPLHFIQQLIYIFYLKGYSRTPLA